MSNTQVTFAVPTDHAAWLVEVYKRPINDIARDLLIDFFNDERRKKCATGKVSYAVSNELNNAMTELCKKHGWGVSGYFRSIIYKMYRSKSPVFDKYRDWAKRDELYNSPTARKTKKREEGTRSARGVFMPEEWSEWLRENSDPREVKAEIQLAVERETGLTFPVQRGMAEYLNR